MSEISKLEKNSNYLKVVWDDGEESKFNYLWLRDNCPTAHDKDSRHRMFNILNVSTNINPKNYKSSWAGAIGIGQFIPSSYMAYGIDYDGDKKVDLVNSLDDGLASVANYLKVHGWSEDAITILEISLNEQFSDLKDNKIKEIDLPFKVNNFNTSIPFNTLQSSDLSNEEYEGQATPLLVYEGTTTKLFLGFDNFRVITKYNRSSFYALAIHQLAMAISEKFDD